MWLPTGHGKLGSVGLSEYKRNFKWKPSEQPRLCNSTHEQKCRWAGLRSDEFGITREPNFISKRRVPYYDTQISKSFQWNGGNGLEKDVLSELEVSEPVKLHKTDSKDVELNKDPTETSDSPRLPEKLHLNSAGSGPESTEALRKSKKSVPQTPVHENKILASTKKELGKTDHGLNRVLQRRAGMNISRSRSFPRSSEYQREFVWKTPQKFSPVLAADQFIHRSSQSIPPFKSPVIIPETEYERNFKPSPPIKQLKQCFLEESECPRSESVEVSSGEKNEKNKTTSKTPEDSNQNELETKQKEEKQKQKLLCSHRHSKKMNTEYRSKFLSPSQYIYKQGAWVHVRKNIPYQGSQNTLNTMWYVEVKELREKAEAYKQRIQGTHFSRDHLNQILSDSNRLWDLSSESTVEETMSNNIRALDLAGIPENKLSSGPKILAQPVQQNSTGNLGVSDAFTIPVKRCLVWDESHDDEQQENLSPILGECKEEENKQEIGEVKEVEKNDKDASINNQQNSSEGRADSSESLRTRGRLPTPQLRMLGGIQRTHHDLTTPAAGGAVLVSPEKGKHSSLLQIEKESSEKQYLGNSQVSREQIKGKTNRDEEKTVTNSSVAGLKTLDPLPLQTDQFSNQDTSGKRNCATLMHSEQIPIVSETKLSKASAIPYWSPLCRIQGSLRDPEFQHNGNIASPKRSWLQLPLQERNYHDEDDDDRLSQLSARSAASGSLASQVLERAQRRKENFWGKM